MYPQSAFLVKIPLAESLQDRIELIDRYLPRSGAGGEVKRRKGHLVAPHGAEHAGDNPMFPHAQHNTSVPTFPQVYQEREKP